MKKKDKMEWPAPEFLTMYCALSGRSGKAGVGGETEVYFKEWEGSHHEDAAIHSHREMLKQLANRLFPARPLSPPTPHLESYLHRVLTGQSGFAC